MAYNREYPYVDPNKYNDDWLLHEMERLRQEWEATKAEWETMKQEWQQMQNGWQQMQTAWENMQQAWQTYQTNLNNAWAQYKANMDADFAEYTTDMDQKWEDYKASLNSEWETYKNNTNAYIQSLIPGSVNNWLDANFEGYWQDYADTIQVPAKINDYIMQYYLQDKTVCFVGDDYSSSSSYWIPIFENQIRSYGGQVAHMGGDGYTASQIADLNWDEAIYDYYIIILGRADCLAQTPISQYITSLKKIRNKIINRQLKAVAYIGVTSYDQPSNVAAPLFFYDNANYMVFAGNMAIYRGNQRVSAYSSITNFAYLAYHLFYNIIDANYEGTLKKSLTMSSGLSGIATITIYNDFSADIEFTVAGTITGFGTQGEVAAYIPKAYSCERNISLAPIQIVPKYVNPDEKITLSVTSYDANSAITLYSGATTLAVSSLSYKIHIPAYPI